MLDLDFFIKNNSKIILNLANAFQFRDFFLKLLDTVS